MVYVNRIVMIIAHTFFSKNKKRNLLNIAAQLLSFTHFSKLKWIALSQTWVYPLKRIIAEGGICSPFLNEAYLKSLKLTTHSLIDPSARIESTLESVFTFSQTFFNKSAWNRYWEITTTNGVETGRKLYYQVTLRGNLFALGSESFLPRVTDYSMEVVDAFYGAVRIRR